MLPNSNIAKDVPTHDILVAGVPILPSYHVKSIVVNTEANRIAYAQIVLFDGGEAKDGFEISDGFTFIPGNEITITAGYRSINIPVFQGVIIKHSIKKTAKRFELIIDCKHPAINMTISQKSKYFYNTQDSGIIQQLVQSYGILLQAAPTKVLHKAMVQYQVSDWEFMLMRAGANGQLVFTLNNEIKITSPDSGLPSGLILDPDSIMEIESEMDAASQLSSVSATTWDPALQQVARTEAVPPAYTEQGNINASILAGVTKHTTYEIRHTGSMENTELQAWADARLLKSRLAKIRGRIKLQGNANVSPGDIIQIQGVGMRFDGPVYVTGVRHSISSKNWETDIQFGLSPKWHQPPVVKKTKPHLATSRIRLADRHCCATLRRSAGRRPYPCKSPDDKRI